MLDTAADGVIGTTMKSCIHKHPTHLDQRPPRLPKQLQTTTALFSFSDLRGYGRVGLHPFFSELSTTAVIPR